MSMREKTIACGIPLSRGKTVTINLVESRGGYTDLSHSPKSITIVANKHDSAEGRVVRLHELIHSRISPKKIRKGIPEAVQAFEDCFVQARFPRGDNRINRDCAVVALRDLRFLMKKFPTATQMIAGTATEVNNRLLLFVRAVASFFACEQSSQKYMRQMLNRLGIRFPTLNQTILNKIQERSLNRRDFNAFEKMFYSASESSESSKATPGRNPGKGSRGEEDIPEMRIVRPELTHVMVSQQHQPVVTTGYAGRFSSQRYINLLTGSGSDCRLWSQRKKREPEGTICIDVSGSMCWATDALYALIDANPFSTVCLFGAIPSHAQRLDAFGDLVIVSEAGKCISKESVPYLPCNGCDAAVIEWLRGQPGPRILISDCKFCGGKYGQNILAHNLLRESLTTGEITLIADANEFELFLKGGGAV